MLIRGPSFRYASTMKNQLNMYGGLVERGYHIDIKLVVAMI